MTRCAAQCQSDGALLFCQPLRTARPRCYETRQTFAKDALCAEWVVAKALPYTEMKADVDACPRQIHNGALVLTMEATGLYLAARTRGRDLPRCYRQDHLLLLHVQSES